MKLPKANAQMPLLLRVIGFITVISISVTGKCQSPPATFTVRDILKEYDAEVIRLFMLSAHYRSPINFSKELMTQAQAGLERLYNCKENLEFLAGKVQDGKAEEDMVKMLENYKKAFIAAMEDDLNTALALSVLVDISREVNSRVTEKSTTGTALAALNTMAELGAVLGILQKQQSNDLDNEIEELILTRQKQEKRKILH